MYADINIKISPLFLWMADKYVSIAHKVSDYLFRKGKHILPRTEVYIINFVHRKP